MQKKQSHRQHTQRGATLIEVLLVFGLLLIIGPFIFRKGFEKSREIKNISIARDIQTVGQAVTYYMESNFTELASRTFPLVLTDQSPELRPYLPSDFSIDSKTLMGMYVGILTRIEGKRVYLSAIVLAEPGSSFSALQSRQIAQLLGAEGGFTDNGDAIGIGGNYTLRLISYGLTSYTDNVPVYVVSYTRNETLAFLENSGEKQKMDDFLWRKNAALYGYESWRNRMETDLLMGNDDSDYQSIDNIGLIEMIDVMGNRTMTIDGNLGIDMGGLSITEAGNIIFKKPADSDYVLKIEGDTGDVYADYTFQNRDVAAQAGSGELRRSGKVYTDDTADRTARIVPSDVSILYDLKLEEFGEATLSELLGDYHLRNVIENASPNQADDFGRYLEVKAPGYDPTEPGPLKTTRCPIGYAPTILVSPVMTSNQSLQLIEEGDTAFFVPERKTFVSEEVQTHATAKGRDRVSGEILTNLEDAAPIHYDAVTGKATFLQLDARAAGGFFIKTLPVNTSQPQPDSTTRLETTAWHVYTNADKVNINVYCKRAVSN